MSSNNKIIRIKSVSFITIIVIIYCCNIKSDDNFSKEQISLILASDSMQPMRVFKTDSYSDSILLRTKSDSVYFYENDTVLNHFARRLYQTVIDSASLGVGIAAPQVGILKRMIWVQRFDKEKKPFELYLNPNIIQYSELKQDCREGCLSVPVIRDTTRTRSYAILVEYDQMDQSHHLEMVEDYTAVIFQHEIDHLNGILFTDRLLESKNQ